jgi:predicted HTH domain antitoxin
MTKSVKIEIPEKLLEFLEDDPEKRVKFLLIFELYREKKITIRQAADILNITYREMEELLRKNQIFIDFGQSDLDEEINYGFSGN